MPSLISGVNRKHRVFWANSYCLLDTFSGASISVREILNQLVIKGMDVAVLGATVFDSSFGAEKFKNHIFGVKFQKSKILKIEDTFLTHELILTRSFKRIAMTTKEIGDFF